MLPALASTQRECAFPFQGVLPGSEQIVMRCESLGPLERAIWEVSVYSWFLGQPQICEVIQTSQSALDI